MSEERRRDIAKSSFKLRNRKLSQDFNKSSSSHEIGGIEGGGTSSTIQLKRRTSMDEKTSKPREYLIEVERIKEALLRQEDTDGDNQVTIKDSGPKQLRVHSSLGHNKYEIRGTYALSNLLQELALASDQGHRHIYLTENEVNEPPVKRLSRMIREHFWPGLMRRIDARGLELVCLDPKDRLGDHSHPRIYVPYHDLVGLNYFVHVAATKPQLRLEVIRLPEQITPAFVKSINDKPGILSLALRSEFDPQTKRKVLVGNPFIVPGGRFNEMYGWDSYFETLGLLCDGYVDICKSMVENFVYQIQHYGKILNANRTYYLTRSQPPFLTDMILVVYERLRADDYFEGDDRALKEWLRLVTCAAIKEYKSVWMSEPRYIAKTGLSRYFGEGLGMPPETEQSHFNVILAPFAERRGLDIGTFSTLYNNGSLVEPELDAYFMHDRAVRESGHDTTYRLEGRAASLNTVDLNCLLFKYERDIARIIDEHFGESCGGFEYEPNFSNALTRLIIDPESLRDIPSVFSALDDHIRIGSGIGGIGGIGGEEKRIFISSREWYEAADRRREAMIKYMWNDTVGLFFDYDFELEEQSKYECMNGAFYPLWCELPLSTSNNSKSQVNCYNSSMVERLVRVGVEKFEVAGGLVCGTEESRGFVGIARPNRQWDYPFGWAPHQMIAWRALLNPHYHHTTPHSTPHQNNSSSSTTPHQNNSSTPNFTTLAYRLIYRWLHTITRSFVDFNGVVPEKFDLVALTHQISVEYGNVGTDFKYVPREGFGWMNASYQYGLEILRRASGGEIGEIGGEIGGGSGRRSRVKDLVRSLNALVLPDQVFSSSQREEKNKEK